jgi:hypothetical protein
MAIGLSIFLITIGAIFRFGITVNLSSLDFHAIGLIIMFAGAALLSIQMFFIARARAVQERRDRTYGDQPYRSTDYQGPIYRDNSYRDDRRPPVLGAGPGAGHGGAERRIVPEA